MSDHKGTVLLLARLPAAKELLADRGYDSNRLRAGLEERGTMPCIPGEGDLLIRDTVFASCTIPSSEVQSARKVAYTPDQFDG